MARRVFFSFHYQQDIWRVSQVRNSWVTRGGESNSYLDAASWESVKRQGDAAVKNWIDAQLSGTGVTVVLIGEGTVDRKYVRYEIQESHRRGNGLLGIHIHRLRDQHGGQSYKGRNPFTHMTTTVSDEGFLGFFSSQKRVRLSSLYPTYDWVEHGGYQNIGDWIEEAARVAGR